MSSIAKKASKTAKADLTEEAEDHLAITIGRAVIAEMKRQHKLPKLTMEERVRMVGKIAGNCVYQWFTFGPKPLKTSKRAKVTIKT